MSDKVLKLVSKPVVAGVTAGLLSWLIFGAPLKGTTEVLGFQVYNPLVIGGAVGAASFVSDLAAGRMLPHIDQESRVGAFEAQLLQPAVTGGAAVLAQVGMAGSGNATDLGKVFALGAVSEFAGAYGYNMLKTATAKTA